MLSLVNAAWMKCPPQKTQYFIRLWHMHFWHVETPRPNLDSWSALSFVGCKIPTKQHMENAFFFKYEPTIKCWFGKFNVGWQIVYCTLPFWALCLPNFLSCHEELEKSCWFLVAPSGVLHAPSSCWIFVVHRKIINTIRKFPIVLHAFVIIPIAGLSVSFLWDTYRCAWFGTVSHFGRSFMDHWTSYVSMCKIITDS